MASAGLEQELDCSICRSLYTDPVTLRCGHSFCRVCIEQHLNTQDETGVYSCPECTEQFQELPALKRNITLRKVVESFRSNHGDDARILCTYCVDSPVTAVKSCLHCEASLCDHHLRVHSTEAEHVLTDPRASLDKWKCSIHKRLLEYYCTDDAACICVSCYLIGEHSGHNLEPLDEAFGKKKEKLRNVLHELITNGNKTEERVRSLEEQRRKAQENAAGEAEGVIAMFIDIRKWVDNLEKKVLSEISRREEKMSLSLSDVINQLEIKKEELSRKMRHIEELCNMTDPQTVLQEPDTGDLCDPEEDGGDEDSGESEADGGDEDTGESEDTSDEDTEGLDGDDQGAKLISYISRTLSALMRNINVIFYVQDPADILLDVTMAHNNLLISDDLKTATWTEITQDRPETAERFQGYEQVMSRRGFTSGRHYWDVEISKSEVWCVGMCYPNIERRENHSFIGYNMMSWGLAGGLLYNNEYSVIHDFIEIELPHQISIDRFRICLDYEAGQLSFYELCDPIRHLHTFTTTFSEPLHAALCVTEGSIKILGSSR